MRKPSAQLLLLALLIVSSAISTLAQNNKGAIVGTVKDPNDALVAKAQVKVTSTKTGEVRNTDTSDDGTYTVTNLEPGTYNVTVEASGFQTVTFEAVQVETNARLPLDVKFASVATSTSSVTITAESAPLVESETSVRGDLITGKEVTDLPIPQRNFTLSPKPCFHRDAAPDHSRQPHLLLHRRQVFAKHLAHRRVEPAQVPWRLTLKTGLR